MIKKSIIAACALLASFATPASAGFEEVQWTYKVTLAAEPTRALLYAAGKTSHYYTIELVALFSTLFKGIETQYQASCQVDIARALITCEGLGLAPLDIIQDDDGESAAYFDLGKLKLDASIDLDKTLIAAFINDPSNNHAVDLVFIPGEGQYVPVPGAHCPAGGSSHQVTGQDCETINVGDQKYQRCCPATKTYECALGTNGYQWEAGNVDVDYTKCTFKHIPPSDGISDPTLTLGAF